MTTGWDLDHVLRMDVLTFNAYVAHMSRIEMRQREEKIWDTMAAVNAGMSGKKDGIQRMVKEWHRALGEPMPVRQPTRGAGDFLRDFGMLGGGGRI